MKGSLGLWFEFGVTEEGDHFDGGQTGEGHSFHLLRLRLEHYYVDDLVLILLDSDLLPISLPSEVHVGEMRFNWFRIDEENIPLRSILILPIRNRFWPTFLFLKDNIRNMFLNLFRIDH